MNANWSNIFEYVIAHVMSFRHRHVCKDDFGRVLLGRTPAGLKFLSCVWKPIFSLSTSKRRLDVMLISAWAFKCSFIRSEPGQIALKGRCALVRYISTNSAINRGIRKSRNVDSRGEFPTRIGSFSRRRDAEATKETRDFQRYRAGHQQSKGQDSKKSL